MRSSRRAPLLLLTLLATACGDGPSGGPVDPPGPPAWMTALPGLPTRGNTGEALPDAPGVVVRDGQGRAVPGAAVTFQVASGGGSVAAASAVTGADGVARSGAWTLGPGLGEQALLVRAGSLSEVIRVAAEWKLTPVALSLPERTIQGFALHPLDDRVWFAIGSAGLYVSADAGATWTLAVPGRGMTDRALAFDPGAPDTVFLGTWDRLMVSGDRGRTWTQRAAFPAGLFIRSVLVSARDGALLVGPQWPPGRTPGVYRSQDRGVTWTHHPYGIGEGQQILTWDLEEDPATGTVWAGSEIADHPEPYRPPFLMSPDGGRTWQDVTARLPFLSGRPWHVIQIERAGGALLALAEGPGLFRSTDGGATWEFVTRDFGLQLGVDPRRPERVFGGDFGSQVGGGGLYASLDGGRSFVHAATVAAATPFSVSGLGFSADGTRLYVASYGGGIMMLQLPAGGL